MSVLNFEEHIRFYAQYHHNKVNQLLHMIGVPLILTTSLVWASKTGPLIDLPFLEPYFPANLAFFAALGYAVFFILMEPVAGTLYFPYQFFLLYVANQVGQQENFLLYTIIIHISSWILQFVGHGVAEKRKPALLDNIFQALVLAPFFVFIEMLFLVGYRPALRKTIDENAKADIAAWKKTLGKKTK